MDVAPTIAADSQADFFQAFDGKMDGKTQKPMDDHQFRLTIAEGPYGILWVPDFQMPGMVAFLFGHGPGFNLLKIQSESFRGLSRQGEMDINRHFGGERFGHSIRLYIYIV